jgi:putative endonuclease
MTGRSRQIGSEGEDTACGMIEGRGFRIIERNYRFGRSGEIDIIAQKDRLLVFVEVKTRSFSHFGGPLYAISPRKKRTLRLVAQQYLCSHPELFSADIECRFDMISILDGRAEWIDDIFR